MAVNEQLKDYISQQLKVGVSKDVISAALLGAGWQDADVKEAMADLGAPAAAAPAASEPKAVSPSVSASPAGAAKIGGAASTFPGTSLPQEKISPPAMNAVAANGPKIAGPSAFITSDIFQSKSEPMFDPAAAGSLAPKGSKGAGSGGPSGALPRLISKEGGETLAASGGAKGSFFGKGLIVPGALGILAAVFAAAAGMLYVQNGDLTSRLAANNRQSEGNASQVASLTKDKNSLADQVASLGQTIADLDSQLSIFAVSANASTTETPVTAKGTLGGGGKSPYTLTTGKQILLTVKNSKDANVDAVLKPIAGQQVEISGTHIPGSASITVNAVNGIPVAPPVSAGATSTAKTATSTSGGAGTKTPAGASPN